MAEMAGNSNAITRRYLDSLLIETRYMNSTFPDTEMTLYGKKFKTPVMTAALSHLDHFMFEGATAQYAEGAAKAGAVLWLGMAEIIKPYADRKLIFEKIRHAEKLGLLAVGVDIDHPFGPDGSADFVDDFEMAPLTTEELKQICSCTPLPVIVKGVLSVYDARQAAEAGAGGIVVSHHNNRIEYALPPLMALPEIRKYLPDEMPVFVDGDIRSGLDVFKALALGANAVCIGRPLMTAVKKGGADAVCEYLKQVNDELKKAMAFTGCIDLAHMDPTVIHHAAF